MSSTATATGTVFDALLAALQSVAAYNTDDVVPPAAILWPDEKREWASLVPRLRLALPHFMIYGPYDRESRTGPAIWLRCVLARKIPECTWAPDTVPIIYLPGVSRATLRATEECPQALKPLAELQYRGVFWSQTNGKDWTITAFLQTEHGGLGLEIARDTATTAAIRRCLDKLVDVSAAELQARSASGALNSTYFDALVSQDLVDDLLTWLSDPQGTHDYWEANRWETLCSRCRADYGFDPARDGALVGAEQLGRQEKLIWKAVWQRYAAIPARYPGLVELLRKAKPQPTGTLFDFARVESWPQDNEAEEADLRQGLLALVTEPVTTARQTLLQLERRHSARRAWVWARLQRAPLACTMEYLATVAASTQTPLTGATTADMVHTYTVRGWRADAAVLDSVSAVTSPPDTEAVCAALAHVYAPWLRDAAELFQARVAHEPLPGRDVARLADVPEGTCVFFVDGLRFDIGQKLKAALDNHGETVQLAHHFVALPSVTPTAKPAISPVAQYITGMTSGEEFRPSVASDGKDLTTDRFNKLLVDEGFQILRTTDVGNPMGRAWTEYGNLDTTGHHEGHGLARRIPELITYLIYRIDALLAAGWQEVRIVTDHGWLLLPTGLPKSDLPQYLTATRWRRCAVVKPSATVTFPCFPWFWSEDVRIACPPGIDCFMAGEEYSHGGLSLQECVVPQLAIRRGTSSVVSAKIDNVRWAGLRCRITVTGQFNGCQADLRDRAADTATSLVGAKAVSQDGTVALVVADDAREGTATTLVLLDVAGNVLDRMPVTVGG